MAARIDPKASIIAVDAVATANLTLSGLQTVDGVSLTAGMLCFAKAQSTGGDRAIYVVQSAAWILVNPGFSNGLQILAKGGSANIGNVYRITSNTVWGTDTPTIVQDGSSAGPSNSFSSGLVLLGSPPSDVADSVRYGVADINGSSTAAEQKNYEGGATMTHRVNGTAGVLYKLEISESVADDGTISLPAPSSGRIGILELYGSPEYGSAFIASDAAVTLTSLVSTNFVATDTDNKLCVFDAGTTVTIRNRLGSTKWLVGSYRWA